MKMDDDLVDDVFEDEYKHYYQNTDTGLNCNEATFLDEQTPSPTVTGHPAYRVNSTATEDGWKSYKINDDTGFDENVLHKVRKPKENSWKIRRNIFAFDIV